MAVVICPKCGLKVRAEDGECFACGARLPRPRIEPEEYYEPTPRQSPARQTPPTQQPEYQQTGYTQNNATPNYNNTGAYQNTPPVGNNGGIPQGSIPARESTQAYSGQTYTRDTLPPPPPITPPPVASSSSTSTASTTPKQSTPKPEKLKNSTLSIVAFVLSILIFPVGLVLGIIDLAAKDKTHKHGFSVAAIVIAGLMAIFVIGRPGKSKSTSTKEETPVATESVAVEVEEAEETKASTEMATEEKAEMATEEKAEVATEEKTEVATEEKTEEQTETATEEKESEENESADDGSIRPDVKKAIDSYEEYMNKYVEFMESYDSSDLTMLTKYAEMMKEYAQVTSDFKKIEDQDLNDAETMYYIDVQTRVNKKLLEVSTK